VEGFISSNANLWLYTILPRENNTVFQIAVIKVSIYQIRSLHNFPVGKDTRPVTGSTGGCPQPPAKNINLLVLR